MVLSSDFIEAYSNKNKAEKDLIEARSNLAQATQDNLKELFDRRMVSISYNRRRIERHI